jgi:hypothetical protein
MLTRISSAISNPTETASELSKIISTNYPNLTENYYYSTLSDKYSTLSNKLNESYPGIYSGLTNTTSTITETFNNGTVYIYSIQNSIGDTVYSYTSMFEPVNAEEREITRTPPNDNLAEKVNKLNEVREEIVNNILDLYSKPSEECFKHYDDNVIFGDPIIYTTGLPNLKAQFFAINKLFVKSTTVNYKILENTATVLRINLNQKYTLPFVGRAVVQNNEITLELLDGKIVKHIDCWYGKPTGDEGGVSSLSINFEFLLNSFI